MLKPGVVFIGKPSFCLHELLSIALYLDAPIALSDKDSYEIAKKFSEIIPVYLITQDFNLNLFTSNFDGLYTNLQPQELAAFFIANPQKKLLETFHIIESSVKTSQATKDKMFCSSLFHNMQMIPLNGIWVNLGAIGHLSYTKHKKAIQKILQVFMPPLEDAKFYVAQVLNDSSTKRLLKQDTLDQIQFLNLSFTESNPQKLSAIIPAHGLIDAAIDLTNATIFQNNQLALLGMHYKKPLFVNQMIEGFYQDVSVLTSVLPKEPKNLVPVIENYFEFETIDREDSLKKLTQKFYSHAKFQNT